MQILQYKMEVHAADLMQQMGKNAAKLQAEYLPEKVNREWADYFQKVAGKKKLV